MTPSLKDVRHELGELIAAELDINYCRYGDNVNVPAVVVVPGSPYSERITYGTDQIRFDVHVFGDTGESSAVVDSLDDLLDGIAAALEKNSTSGYRYSWESISPPGDQPVAGQTLASFVVGVLTTRECD